jgi:hypothetical protein
MKLILAGFLAPKAANYIQFFLIKLSKLIAPLINSRQASKDFAKANSVDTATA